MKKQRWELLVAAVAFTGLGLATGWWSAPPKAETKEAEDHAAGASQVIPPQTQKNLGVTIDEIQPTSFSMFVDIAAVVEETPFTEQPVFAPIGGQVQSIVIEPGSVVTAGSTLVTIVRESIPRPSLTLTADILKPAQEQIHVLVVQLRKSLEEVRIGKTELDRVQKFTGTVGGKKLPVLPRQVAIDLRYQLNRAEKDYELARLELSKHGLSTGQIAALETGGAIPRFTQETWKRALANNGLWTELSEKLYVELPKELQDLPWVIATIGELTASGLNTDEFVAWIKGQSSLAKHFLEYGVLLQKGYTIADLDRLLRLNAFDPIVKVCAPGVHREIADWDVRKIAVKPLARVEAGTPLVLLDNPRKLYLRTEPVGGEIKALLAALSSGSACRARPLVRDSGPVMEDLHIAYLTSAARGDETVAYVGVTNRPLPQVQTSGGIVRRSWELRPGQRYILQVPLKTIENVYVLPSAAVAEDGPNRVVFIPDGDSFKSVPVEIAYQDDEVVVIPINKDTQLAPGDRVVQGGAFALGLALKAGTGKVDAHAGHSH